MGVVPPAPGFLELLRRAGRRHRRTAGVRRGDQRLPRRSRRRPGDATPSCPTSSILGKIIGGGFPAAAYGGPAVADGADRAGGRRLPGGDAVGKPGRRAPPGWPRSPSSTTPPTTQLERTTERARRRPARGRRRAPAGRSRSRAPAGSLTVFFSDEPVHNYADAAACDLDAYGAWCRALLDRGVYPPASQFEAWFPSLAARRGRAGPHDRGGAAALCGDRDERSVRRTSFARQGGALAELATVPPTPWSRPGPGPAGGLGAACCRARAGLRAAARDDLRGIAASLRRAQGGPARATPTSRCCSATSCTRWGCRAWPSWVTSMPWPSSPT